MKPTVLVIDDSAVARSALTQALTEAGLEVIGAAKDPLFAMERMARHWPDVIVMDLETSRMDGLTFLRQLAAEHPTPVVVCSRLTEPGSATTQEALATGAVACLTKPRTGFKEYLEGAPGPLVEAVWRAARRPVAEHPSPEQHHHAPPATPKLVAIGASTGGSQALEVLLQALPADSPPILVVLHMPENFTRPFASRLNKDCALEVKEAEDLDPVQAGRALIAPGGHHLRLERQGTHYRVRLDDSPPVNRHRPSVDVLFSSVAREAGRNALGIILTGMGDDGARGLLEMHQAGAMTLGQDERTCVVYGMPKEAMKRGAVDRELPLKALSAAIVSYNLGYLQVDHP